MGGYPPHPKSNHISKIKGGYPPHPQKSSFSHLKFGFETKLFRAIGAEIHIKLNILVSIRPYLAKQNLKLTLTPSGNMWKCSKVSQIQTPLFLTVINFYKSGKVCNILQSLKYKFWGTKTKCQWAWLLLNVGGGQYPPMIYGMKGGKK